MKFKFWKNKTEKKSMALGHDAFNIFSDIGSTLASTTSGAMAFYKKSSSVSIPVDMIADPLSVLVPILVDTSTKEVIRNHELLDFLKRPSPNFSQQEFLKFLTVNSLVTGNIFVAKIGNPKYRVIEISPVASSNAEVYGIREPEYLFVSGNYLGGNYQSLTNDNHRYFISENGLAVIHQSKNYSPENNSLLMGESPLLSISPEINQGILGNEMSNNKLKKGNNLDRLFHFEDKIEDDYFQELKSRIRKEYGGTNSESIAVTSGENLKISTLGSNNKDMDFALLQQSAKETVAIKLKIPLPLLSNDASTYNNVEQARWSLYDEAIFPEADRIFSFLTDILFDDFDIDKNKFKLTYDLTDVTALQSRTAQTMQKRVDMGIETTNELRKIIGRDDISGGDAIYHPNSELALGTVQPMQQIKKKDYELKQNRLFSIEHKALDVVIDDYQDGIHSALTEQQLAVFAALDKGIDDEESILLVIEKSGESLEKELEFLFIDAALGGGKSVVVEKKGLEEDLLAGIEDIYDKELTVLVEKSLIDKATSEIILDKIRIGNDEGWTITELQDSIIKSGAFSPERALRISRTAAGTAQSIGSQVGAENAGANFKTWGTAGHNVRSSHSAISGVKVPFKELYPAIDGVRPRYPRDQRLTAKGRVNCRCFEQYSKE